MNVYIPNIAAPLWNTIDRASGIVGTPGKLDPNAVLIDYEGNRYNAMNIVTWADRVYHAYDRHTWNEGRGYPTIARLNVDPHEVVRVGSFDPEAGKITLDLNEKSTPELMSWLAWGVPLDFGHQTGAADDGWPPDPDHPELIVSYR